MQSSLCWANSVFRDWIGDIDNDQKLDHIMPNLNIDKFWGKFGYFFEHIDKRYYRVVYKYLQTEAAEDDNYLILYFEDITDTETQKMNCIASVPVLCDIEIDNMEEVAKGMTSVQQTTLWTNVNNCLIDELTSLGAFVRSYGNEKYFACLSREALDELKKDNFSFLEKIRMIHTVNRIPVTLSMGVAACPKDVVTQGMVNFNELADKAQAGLDLALGRGGDQVVVYEEDGSPHFYGGKTRSVEKNTRVRARVVAQAIRELIDTSDLVLVMGMNGKITTASELPSAWLTWPASSASPSTSSSASRPTPSDAWKRRYSTCRPLRTCSFRRKRRKSCATARRCCLSSIPIGRT